MPEYVYALHDFVPEHDDELTFNAGERIEVVEKDDLYGDGWWQGKSLAGKIGLFPQAYTTPSQPGFVEARSLSSTVTPMQRLDEESDGAVVMAATLTDVQEAIEQLGGGKNEQDASRSFSFSSSHDEGGDTDVTDREDTGHNQEQVLKGEEWHRGARALLAQNAQKEMEKKKLKEREQQRSGRSVLPIQAELSDESEPEEDDQYQHTRQLPPITSVAGNMVSPVSTPVREMTVTEEDEEEEEAIHIPNPTSNSKSKAYELRPSSMVSLPTPISPQSQLPISEMEDVPMTATLKQPTPVVYTLKATHPTFDSISKTESTTKSTEVEKEKEIEAREVEVEHTSHLPSPAPSSSAGAIGLAAQIPLPKSPDPISGSQQGIVSRRVSRQETGPISVSSTQNQQRQEEGYQLLSTAVSPAVSAHPSVNAGSTAQSASWMKIPPAEWSVEVVVEWLKSKGFDEGVCGKFIEHDISGDVLLELDVNTLKELEIHAFGKRKRIEHAIAELNKIGQVGHLGHTGGTGNGMGTGSASFVSEEERSSTSLMHSRQVSLSGSGYIPVTPSVNGEGESERSGRTVSDSIAKGELVGLGIENGAEGGGKITKSAKKSKPASLVLSPSDGALRKRATAGSADFIPEERDSEVDGDMEIERPALSETETPPSTTSRSRRRRVFGKSIESVSSKGGSSPRDSKDLTSSTTGTSLPGSPFVNVSLSKRGSQDEKANGSSGRNGKGGERLSFFSGSLGKTRKPAPRFSSGSSHTDETEKAHGLGRLLPSHSARRSIRPSTPKQPESKVEKDDQKDKGKDQEKEKEKRLSPPPRDAAVLRKRSATGNSDSRPESTLETLKSDGGSILDQIGTPDHSGWLRKKGERYNTWKLRYLVLKGPHLYYLRSDGKAETKIKGYINIRGYKVLADENVNPGRYGFRVIHEVEKPHFFSSEERIAVREWMKALMKATIGRDYSKPVISSCNIPTIPLTVAQAMNPAPRPPSPTARDATQKALRRDNPGQLSSRDAQVLMGLPSPGANGAESVMPERADLDQLFASVDGSVPQTPQTPAPPRPSRDTRTSSAPDVKQFTADPELVLWANGHLALQYQFNQGNSASMSYGLSLLRLAEDIKGSPCEPPVPDHAFPTSPNDERLEGLFSLFDMLLDEDVKMGSVSINDVRQGKPDKIVQLLRALKAWEEKREGLARRIGAGSNSAGPWMAME